MGDTLQLADLGAALPPDPIAANATSLGAPANLVPKNPAVAVPKKTEDTFTIARRQREAGENPSRDPTAQNPHSSAGGNNQIIDRTWLDLMGKYRPELVEGKTKDEILAMKLDGPLNDQMAGQYDRDNAKFMASNGIAPTPNMLNAAYRAGPQGALAIVQAAHSNPNTLVKDVAPDMATPGNNGAGNLTVGQFLMNPYQHGPGADAGSSPQQLFSIAKGNQILAQLQADSDQGRDRLAKLDRDYKPIEFPKMPKPPEVDPLQTFGSLAGVFATLAAGFSRTPMTAALNGLAGAMDSAKKAKWEDYQAHYEQFKFGTEMAIKAHEMHSADIKDALEMMTKNMAAGKAMLDATIALSQDEEAQKDAEIGNWVRLGHRQDEKDANALAIKNGLPVTYATADLTAALENLKHAQTSGDPAEIAQAETLVTQSESKLAGVKRAQAGGGGTAAISAPQWGMFGGQRVLGTFDKATGQYEALGSREPMPGFEPEGKTAAPGSTAADRAAIAADVNADPDFKEATQGARAAEIEKRFAVASGKLTDPAARHDIAQGIANYQIAPLTGYALNRPGGQETMAEVMRLNPDFEATQFNARRKAAQDFATGTQGRAINSFNVAIAHLGTLQGLADALNNGDVQAINRLSQNWAQQTGSSAPTNFDAAKQIIGQEIVKAIIASGGGVTERQDAAEKLNRAQSPEQINGVIDTYKDLMAGQLRGLKRQYEQTVGLKNFDDRLAPETRELLTRAQPHSGTVHDVANEGEYKNLSTGDWYRKPGDPPGSHRIKQ